MSTINVLGCAPSQLEIGSAALTTADLHGGLASAPPPFPPPTPPTRHHGVSTPAHPLIQRLAGTGSTPSEFEALTYNAASSRASR